jgi:hypothetical protein
LADAIEIKLARAIERAQDARAFPGVAAKPFAQHRLLRRERRRCSLSISGKDEQEQRAIVT